MNKKYILLLFFCFLFLQTGSSQTRDARLRTKGYINPQEIVSLDSTMRMDQALLVINELAKQFAGKVIIDLEKRKGQIGVYVVNQHWRDALDMILSRNGLTYIEEPEYIRILSANAAAGVIDQRGAGAQQPAGEPPPTLASRDVKISAVFFDTDLQKLQNFGISWNFARSKPKEPNMDFYNSAGIGRGDSIGRVPPTPQTAVLDKALGVLKSPPEFTFANIEALVKFFGSNQLGEVIVSPEVSVRNAHKGKIQVGKNIFVVTKDIAGNPINTQVQTGTIIEVTPTVYTQSDTDFIYLDLNVEQSDAAVGETGPEIQKTAVTTHALLYDGEETIIGGLFRTFDQEFREGVPFLKDLPWWFLGLRYVFGSETKTKQKHELVILLKAELSQPIRGRINSAKFSEQELINTKRREFQKQFDKK